MQKLLKSLRPSRSALVFFAVVFASFSLVTVAAASGALAQDDEPTETVRTPSGLGNGRIAYVTPEGAVVVADVDGSNAKVIGQGAATNAVGLAPLAWRQPAADAVTYVRTDGSLVVAPVDGGPEQIVATDAVVPPEADERLISWFLNGSLLSYLAQSSSGNVESRVIDFTEADTDRPPIIRTVGNPDRRVVLGQQFAPLDPWIYQRTVDIETGEELTVAIVEPIEGAIFGTPFTLDDPSFSPDGRYLVAVVTGTTGNQQLVRVPQTSPRLEVVADHEQVCNPAVSADGNSIVYAAGPDCQEVWTVDINAANRTKILDRAGPQSTFRVGQFSWSPDGDVVTHAACTGTDEDLRCGGGYWDIETDGSGATERADAGSVLREQVALLRPAKFSVHLDGGVVYDGVMQVGAEGTELLEGNDSELTEASIADQNDPNRLVELKMYQGKGEAFLSGTIRVIDGETDETVVFFGRAQPVSYRFASIRGLWTKTDSIPIRSGQILIEVSR